MLARFETVCERSQLSPQQVQAVIDTLVTLLEEGQTVELPGLGRLVPKIREPRQIRSPLVPGGVARSPRRRVVTLKLSTARRQAWTLD